jgi:multidrug efflux pump subunit AcrB
VVLTDLSTDPLARTGQPQAMARVVRRATGHVLATTLTTMAGFLPLIIAGGQFWPPLAVAIGMGVAGATLIALGLVPVAFRLSRRRAERQLA